MKQAPLSRGFSLIELMVVVAALGLVATVGFGVFSHYKAPIAGMKLEKDAATLNAAVSSYLASGGALDSVTEVEAVLAKLKTRAAAEQVAEIAGLKGTFLDRRVKAVMQTAAEAATSEPRLVWNESLKRFNVATGGEAGAKKIVLDEAITGAPAEETRDVKLKLATEDKWVWDYSESSLPSRKSYSEVPVATIVPTSASTPGAGSMGPLQAPSFSEAGGNRPLTDYNLTLILSDPNPPGTSQMMVSTDGGSSWNIYSSAAISVSIGMTVSAYSASIDPDDWLDSPVVSEVYTTTPVELELDFVSPQLAVNYAEVGGAMIPGGSGSINPLTPAMITLANSAEIPTDYQNDSVFTVHWSYDGSDPRTSSSRQTTPAFSGGYPGQEIEYSLPWWGNGSVLPVQAVAQSFDTDIVTDSSVKAQVFSVNPIYLRAPVITFSGANVEIDAVTDYGDTPVGARIYYTVDGSDPGDLNGVPTSGTLYTGPFPAATIAGGDPVKARVYGPDAFEHWFTASPIAMETAPTAAIVFSMTVSTTAP